MDYNPIFDQLTFKIHTLITMNLYDLYVFLKYVIMSYSAGFLLAGTYLLPVTAWGTLINNCDLSHAVSCTAKVMDVITTGLSVGFMTSASTFSVAHGTIADKVPLPEE